MQKAMFGSSGPWWRRILAGIGLCIALLFGAGPVLAQVDQGTITGAVTDPQGAVIPAAQITLQIPIQDWF